MFRKCLEMENNQNTVTIFILFQMRTGDNDRQIDYSRPNDSVLKKL